MISASENLVPKVHPATRAVEPDDPMTLHATPAGGDPLEMLHFVIEEFAWMGWDLEMILRLFRDPEYPALYGLRLHFGESVLRREIERRLARRGVLHVRCTIREASPPCGEPDLVEIAIPQHLGGK